MTPKTIEEKIEHYQAGVNNGIPTDKVSYWLARDMLKTIKELQKQLQEVVK